MSQYVEEPDIDRIVEHKSDLIGFFHEGGKPREAWRVGTEYESIGVYRRSGRAVRYSGGKGIEAILHRLAEVLGWELLKEENHIIGLKGPKLNISLEPGGQVELSGKPHKTIHGAHRELTKHIKNLVKAGKNFDVSFLGLGMQPVSGLEDIEWVPKTRYRIMAPYMRRVSSLGHCMMKQTASIQVNIDYSGEKDAMTKFRVGMGFVPILGAMFANSPITHKTLNGFMTLRGHVWTDTDNARSGMLPFAFRESGFEDYVEYALDVPMYFIIRRGRWINMTGVPFRQFLEKGYKGESATLEDWGLHLTTLFPEVRMKKYIEIRCFDNQPQELIPSVPALIKGIFYDPDCLLAAWDLVKSWSWEDRVALYNSSHRNALSARIGKVTLLDLAKELVLISWEGLKRHNQINDKDEDETIYLERLRDELWRGRCPAYVLVKKWTGEWNRDIEKLIDYSAYRMPEKG